MLDGRYRKKLMSLLVILACVSFVTTFVGTAAAGTLPVTGQVWVDLNGDGRKTASGYIDDAGFSGATVTAFDSAGATSSATSSSNGNYSIDVSLLDAGPYRIELSVPGGYKSAPTGSATDSTVRQSVASGANNVDFGIEDPTTYCSSNPRLMASCFVSGNGQLVGTAATAPATKAFRFDDTGYPAGTYPASAGFVAPTNVSTQAQVGTVYGLGYSRATGYVYEGAFLRRHAGLGPGGLGAIYETDPNTGAVVRTITIASAGTTPASRDLNANAGFQS